jgi:hypothetical protein
MIKKSRVSTFQIAEIELSDKERAHWGSAITVNRRSVNKLVLVGSRP